MASPPRSPKLSSHRSSSSTNNSFRHRPKLLRSTATEPSVSASFATGSSRVSPSSSPGKASDLLSRVAVHSPPSSLGHGALSDTLRRDSTRSIRSRDSDVSTSDGHEIAASLQRSPSSDSYFSFPSFDQWDESKHDESEEVFN